MEMSLDDAKPMPKRNKFWMKEVHVHYNCYCSNRPEIRLIHSRRIVEIEVGLMCPRCEKGEAEELIIGGIGIKTGRCPVPGCSCNAVTLRVPLEQFITFLNTPAH